MRKLFASLSAASVLMASAGSQVVWLKMNHDFGAFDESLGTVECQIKGVNVGDEPLVVLNARANCGCTTPRYSREPVAPGDTAVITIGYDAVGRPGRFSKNVMVTTNTEPARATFNIHGTVIGTSNTLKGRYPYAAGKLHLKSDKLAFGEITNNTVGSKYIEGYNGSSDSIRIFARGLQPGLSLTMQPSVVAPGELFVVSALLDGSQISDWDVVTDSFTISNGNDSLKISTVAIVREYFTEKQLKGKLPAVAVQPREVDFDRLSADRTVTGKVTLTNSGDAPLIIRKVSCADPAVTLSKFSDKPVKPGKKTEIQFTVDPSKTTDPSMLNALLVIITNDPVTPRTAVRIVGEIQ